MKRKYFIGISAIVATAVPLATVVSCGNEKKKEVVSNGNDVENPVKTSTTPATTGNEKTAEPQVEAKVEDKWEVNFARKTGDGVLRVQPMSSNGVTKEYKDDQGRIFMTNDRSKIFSIDEQGEILSTGHWGQSVVTGDHDFSYIGDFDAEHVIAITNDAQTVILNKTTGAINNDLVTTKLQDFISQIVDKQSNHNLSVNWKDPQIGQQLDYISFVKRFGDKVMILGKTKAIGNSNYAFTFAVMMDANGDLTEVNGLKQGYNGDDIASVFPVDDEFKAVVYATIPDPSTGQPSLQPMISKIEFAENGDVTLATHSRNYPNAPTEEQLKMMPPQAIAQMEAQFYGMMISGMNPDVWSNFEIAAFDGALGRSVEGKLNDLDISREINEALHIPGFATARTLANGRIVFAKTIGRSILFVNSNGIAFTLNSMTGAVEKVMSLLTSSEWADIARTCNRLREVSVQSISNFLWTDKDMRNNIVDHVVYNEETKQIVFAKLMNENWVTNKDVWHEDAIVERNLNNFLTQDNYYKFDDQAEHEWTQGRTENIGEVRMIETLGDIYVAAGHTGSLAILNKDLLIQTIGLKTYLKNGQEVQSLEVVYDNGNHEIPDEIK